MRHTDLKRRPPARTGSHPGNQHPREWGGSVTGLLGAFKTSYSQNLLRSSCSKLGAPASRQRTAQAEGLRPKTDLRSVGVQDLHVLLPPEALRVLLDSPSVVASAERIVPLRFQGCREDSHGCEKGRVALLGGRDMGKGKGLNPTCCLPSPREVCGCRASRNLFGWQKRSSVLPNRNK